MSLPPFTDAELAELAGTVKDSMQDTCLVCTYTELAGELNEPEVTYVAGEPIACRYYVTAGVSRPGADYGLAGIDAIVHLPPETTITNLDRVSITARYGQRLTPVHTYAVVGDPAPGIASIEVKLQEMHL